MVKKSSKTMRQRKIHPFSRRENIKGIWKGRDKAGRREITLAGCGNTNWP
jgi:hypothetical protein